MNLTASLRMPLSAWLAGALLSLILTGFARRIAVSYHFTDRPRADRAHRTPTPYLGGTAIVIGTAASGLVMGPHPSLQLLVIVAAATLVGLLGLLDDLRSLGTGLRLVVETMAAFVVVAAGVRLDLLGPLLSPPLGTVADVVVTVLAIVGITNAVNLLDNMDGAAAVVVCVTGAMLTFSADLAGMVQVAVLLAALSGACAGFLPYNHAPARIFMGDAGSLFLGFLLASGSILAHPSGHPLSTAAGALLALLVPVTDTVLVVVSRRRAGRSCFKGGTDHISHRLAQLGLRVPTVVTVLAAAAGASALLGVLVTHRVLPAGSSLLAALALTVTAIRRLLRVPVYASLPQNTASARPPDVPPPVTIPDDTASGDTPPPGVDARSASPLTGLRRTDTDRLTIRSAHTPRAGGADAAAGGQPVRNSAGERPTPRPVLPVPAPGDPAQPHPRGGTSR